MHQELNSQPKHFKVYWPDTKERFLCEVFTHLDIVMDFSPAPQLYWLQMNFHRGTFTENWFIHAFPISGDMSIALATPFCLTIAYCIAMEAGDGSLHSAFRQNKVLAKRRITQVYEIAGFVPTAPLWCGVRWHKIGNPVFDNHSEWQRESYLIQTDLVSMQQVDVLFSLRQPLWEL